MTGTVVGCGPSVQSRQAATDQDPASVSTTPGGDQKATLSPSTPQTHADGHPALRNQPQSDATRLDLADRLAQSGEVKQSMEILRELMIIDPGNPEVLFRLANLYAVQGSLAEAVELLHAIPEDDPQAGLPSLGQSADWCFQLERYADAERKYRRVLELAPNAALAHRQLAFLLNRQGRRHEAAIHVRSLSEIGDIRQDELQSLIVLSDAMYDDPKQATSDESPAYLPIGNSGEARRLFNLQNYDEVMRLLEPEVAMDQPRPAIVALYGRAAIESQNDEQYRWWLTRVDESTREFSEYWAAEGTHLLAECRFEEAARALGEAIDRDPTDLISIGRLHQTLLATGDTDLAEKWQNRWRQLRDIVRVNNRISSTPSPDPELLSDLASRLDVVGFKLQAVLWKSIEASARGLSMETHQRLNAQHQALVKSNSAFPDRSTRLCGMDLDRYPLPSIDITSIGSSTTPAPHSGTPIENVDARFVNVADEVGLVHEFSVASVPQDSGFTIYQFFGGAIAVLDYDLDGSPDLYLGQGAADPPTFVGDKSNLLYRNSDQSLMDVTSFSSTSETRYTTGITSGDWNQDGFPDIVVSNIGGDRMLINNGDGSFRSQSLKGDYPITRVPTSLAMADLNGDSLPDLFQLAYVDDSDFTRRPKRNDAGQVISSLLPTDFSPGADRMIINDGRGGQVEANWDASADHSATGLGVVVANFDGRRGNEVFIGNDVRPNQFWQQDAATGQWNEVALPLGCAYGFTGGATASMGIAAGDFDDNGNLDLHITNYQDDAVSLYLFAGGVFRDRNVQFNLNAASRGVLGFGTQSIDFDNDGLQDLVVTNGHVEDEAGSNASFKQPPQLFRNMHGAFELVEVFDRSGYWSDQHLGRALARVDFNGDGRMDFVVSHLGAPTALLVNETITSHHWLQLQLVGTQSERDAIGAVVKIRTSGKESSHWVVAGDGYFSRNEAVVPIGLGKDDHVDEITITWPSGSIQTLTHIDADQRLLVIENEAASHDVSSAK